MPRAAFHPKGTHLSHRSLLTDSSFLACQTGPWDSHTSPFRLWHYTAVTAWSELTHLPVVELEFKSQKHLTVEPQGREKRGVDRCESANAATATRVWKKVGICLPVSVGGCDT